MIYKTYENYKDSEIEWIGEIPEHWSVFKLKHLVNEFIAGGTPKSSEDKYWSEDNTGIPWVAIGDLPNNGLVTKTSKSLTSEGLASKNLKILSKGTILYSIFATLGKVSILDIDATTNQAILGLILSDKIDVQYLKYYLESLKEVIISLSNANTQNNLNSTIVKNIYLSLPQTISEQKNISLYLDKKINEIDDNISKNKKIISLLEEKKISLINYKIFDESYPQFKLKHILQPKGYIRGPFGSSLKREELLDEGIPVYEQYNAIYDSRRFRYFINEEKYNSLKRFTVMHNDLIVSCSGTIGKVSIIKENDSKGIISQALLILRIKTEMINPKFLKYFLESHKGHNYLIFESMGSAQINISSKEVIESIPINLPNLDIQNEIVYYLDSKIKNINKTIEKVQSQIELLEEYKQSLIYHAVTGKIDVREVEV